MQAALEFAGLGSLAGKSVAMQGLGNVGASMVAELLEAGVARIAAADISAANVEAARLRFQGAPVTLRLVERGDDHILTAPSDVLAPNALGGVLNPITIPKLQAKIVCGAANNQLLDPERDAKLLAERGIVFIPDFVANRMGIVNCANEQYGRLSEDPAILKHFDRQAPGSVFQVTLEVLRRASERSETPTTAANLLADELGQTPHPIWGHRTQHIIDDLVRTGWANR
jgi:glutamate dehydrogenase/leucine dehydrogenase